MKKKAVKGNDVGDASKPDARLVVALAYDQLYTFEFSYTV